MTTTHRSLTARWAHAALLLLCAYFVIDFLWRVLVNVWPGPYFDYWADIPGILRYFDGNLRFDDLVRAHNNSHRILVPRLLFLLDYQFFSGTNILLVATSLLSKLVVVASAAWLLQEQPRFTRLLLLTLTVVAVCNAANVANVLFNSNMQWDLLVLFSVLAVGCFVIALLSEMPAMRWFAAAYLFATLDFLSQGGSLAVLPVFIALALAHHRWRVLIGALLFATAILYCNSIWPLSAPDDNSMVQSALATLLFKPASTLQFIVRFLSAGIAHWNLPAGNWLSGFFLALFAITLPTGWRDKHPDTAPFFWLALCFFIMIVMIASARSDFANNTWWAARYQVIAIMFMLSLSCYSFLALTIRLPIKHHTAARSLIVAHTLAAFLFLHVATAQDGFVLSDKVFVNHSFIFFHERTQHYGRGLILFAHNNDDVIATSDSFLRERGYAYYSNKLVQRNGHAVFLALHDGLTAEELGKVSASCMFALPTASINYSAESGEWELLAPLPATVSTQLSLLKDRNSYYLLDAAGVVVGYADILIDPEKPLRSINLHGFVLKDSTPRYTAASQLDEPYCFAELPATLERKP